MRAFRKIVYTIGVLLQVLCFQTACTDCSESPREVININNCWKYAQGDYNGAEQVDYDDENWEDIGIPHSFSIPYFMAKDFYVGYGWYRKHLQLDGSFQNGKERIALAASRTSVFSDGFQSTRRHLVGESPGSAT